MLILYILILLLTFYLLAIICDQYFVESLDRIAKRLNLSSEVTGATFMAIGSSAPELFTSIFALFTIFNGPSPNVNIGAGTIVGSAIFNILVIIGATAITMRKTRKVERQPILRDIIFYLLSITLLAITFWDGHVYFYESMLFVVFYGIYIVFVKYFHQRFHYKPIKDGIIEQVEKETKKNPINKNVTKILSYIIPDINKGKNGFRLTFGVSIFLIAVLSHFMVESAVELAKILNIPQIIIGLTILAVGTSIPDLISSIIVAKRGKGNMAISNALGSNIFDILFGLGFIYFIYQTFFGFNTVINVDSENLISSILLLLGSVVIIFFVLYLNKRKVSKIVGHIFIRVYILYIIYKIIIIS